MIFIQGEDWYQDDLVNAYCEFIDTIKTGFVAKKLILKYNKLKIITNTLMLEINQIH